MAKRWMFLAQMEDGEDGQADFRPNRGVTRITHGRLTGLTPDAEYTQEQVFESFL